jgi:hypothetical protein
MTDNNYGGAQYQHGLRFIDSLTRSSRIIAWADPGGSPLGFNVYRSRTNRFTDATQLNTSIVTVTFFEDASPEVLQRVESFTYYYWFTIIDSGGTEGVPIGPVWQPFEPISHSPLYDESPSKSTSPSIRRISHEIRRRHAIIESLDGETVHYLVRKVAGATAIDYDNYRRDAPYRGDRSFNSQPDGNYGTRFQGGYVLVPNVLVRYIPAVVTEERQDEGLVVNKNPSIWTVDFPLFNPRDIIVRQNNDRFELTTIRPQSLGGRITRQVAEIEYLPSEHIIYSYPVPAFTSAPNPTRPEPGGSPIGWKPDLPDESSN